MKYKLLELEDTWHKEVDIRKQDNLTKWKQNQDFRLNNKNKSPGKLSNKEP